MSDPKKSRNFVVAKGPVNRRTAAPSPAKAQIAPVLRERMQQAQARHLLGAPLAQRLGGAHGHKRLQGRLTPVAILQLVGATMGACAGVLGALQGSQMLGVSGAVLLAGCGLWALVVRRLRQDAVPTSAVAWVDAGDLQQLDLAMEHAAAHLPQEAIDPLARLKESMVHCVALMAQSPPGSTWMGEDQLYIREAVRRYLPDSLAAYLQVPSKDRAKLDIEDGKTALALLLDQLAMIQQHIDACTSRLTQDAGEALVRQQRFLATKKNHQQ